MLATIRTVGQADINEHIEFITVSKLKVGDRILLVPSKPKNAPVYGEARVTLPMGIGKEPGSRRYRAVRVS